MIADAMDHHGACPFGKIREAILDRKDDAVVQRIALGRAVETHGQHRARLLDFEQPGWTGRGGGGVSHGFYWFLWRIVIFYN